MKHFAGVVMLALIVASPVSAQVVHQVHIERGTRHPDGLPIIHVNEIVDSLPASQQAAAEYLALKARGAVGLRKTTETYQIYDTRNFKVYNFDSQQFDNIGFTLEREGPDYLIWVETAELGAGHVRAQDLDAFEDAIGHHTPANSVDPNKGILENDMSVFGQPPDVDGDGKTEILMVDVRDGRSEGDGYVAGFVTSADLGSQGNDRDIVYIDTQPGLYRDNGSFAGTAGIEATLAHEFQHLILNRYKPNREMTFVNEGLSEWAEVVNGYGIRTPNYLNDASAYNVSLLSFRSSSNARVGEDYQRAGLFTNYIADQAGAQAAGNITSTSLTGEDAYRQALSNAGRSFENVVASFHVTNWVNDVSVDPRYGFTTPERLGFTASPGLSIDGRTTTSTPSSTLTVQRGAVQYIQWHDVKDMNLTFSGVSGNFTALQGFAVLTQGNDTQVQPISRSLDPHLFAGVYDEVTLVVADTEPNGNPDVPSLGPGVFRYEATWTKAQEVEVRDLSYDNGQIASRQTNAGDSQNLFVSLGNSGSGQAATMFNVPDGPFVALDRVELPLYFINQFVDGNGNPIGTPEDPRDLVFHVWADDAAGQPGTELFSLPVEDTRPFHRIQSLSIDFLEIDLAPFASELNDLPSLIHIGLSERVNDGNNIVLGAADYFVQNVSNVIFQAGGDWTPLWNLRFTTSGVSLENTVIPIRATFIISPTPVAAEDAPELPSTLALEQNYPNPFNPSTSIRFRLPEAGDVRLAVYDVLGRQVALLADGFRAAGAYDVTFDASGLASGVYLYTLETQQRTLTRSMMLVK